MLEIAAVRAGLAWVKSAGRAAARNLRAAAQPQVCGGSAKRSGFAKSRDCKTGRIERHEKCAQPVVRHHHHRFAARRKY